MGHLPHKLSKVTKIFSDRGVVIKAVATDAHYRGSLLVQGRLEITCLVVVEMH